MAQLTVIVPVYNEVKTIRQILEKIASVNINKEIIVVDNCSVDGTQAALQDILKMKDSLGMIKVIYHSYNKGKGTSVREAIQEASGEFVVIQDADLEYDPQEYFNLLQPLLDARAEMTLGVRFLSGRKGLLAHRWGNKFLTGFLNLMFASHLNDYATCYKMASRSLFLELNLKSKSFDIEVEIICKILKRHLRILEVPVSYYPRSYLDGKKIRWFDGLHAIFSIIKYRLLP